MSSQSKRLLAIALTICLILVGIGIIAYPTISDLWNQAHQSKAIAGYSEAVEALNEADYASMKSEAQLYNEDLLTRHNRFLPTKKDSNWYKSLLNVTKDGMMAYIEIPSINVNLPIYHGTSDAVLQTSIGHLEGSSLPIGGPSTHTVLSGHRGLPSAKLFSRLDELKVGDVFYVNVLGERLKYVVDNINIVLPEEMEGLDIVEGEDFCTLITCTPYGVNSHRLLVRGSRES